MFKNSNKICQSNTQQANVNRKIWCFSFSVYNYIWFWDETIISDCLLVDKLSHNDIPPLLLGLFLCEMWTCIPLHWKTYILWLNIRYCDNSYSEAWPWKVIVWEFTFYSRFFLRFLQFLPHHPSIFPNNWQKDEWEHHSARMPQVRALLGGRSKKS